MDSLFGGGGASMVPAAEAVSPGGMTPGEFAAIPGASGGAAPTGAGDSWIPSLGQTGDILKIIGQIQQMQKANQPGVPGTVSIPQLAARPGQPFTPTQGRAQPMRTQTNPDMLRRLMALLGGTR